MRAWPAAAVAAAVVAGLGLAAGGRDDGVPAGEPLSVAATPFPQPTADPSAGEPAYVGSVVAWLVLLDASGRVARVGPWREAGATVKTLRVLAPGRRRVVLRTRGEVPQLDASGIYVADDAGVRQRSPADGRILARLPRPASRRWAGPGPSSSPSWATGS